MYIKALDEENGVQMAAEEELGWKKNKKYLIIWQFQ